MAEGFNGIQVIAGHVEALYRMATNNQWHIVSDWLGRCPPDNQAVYLKLLADRGVIVPEPLRTVAAPTSPAPEPFAQADPPTTARDPMLRSLSALAATSLMQSRGAKGVAWKRVNGAVLCLASLHDSTCTGWEPALGSEADIVRACLDRLKELDGPMVASCTCAWQCEATKALLVFCENMLLHLLLNIADEER